MSSSIKSLKQLSSVGIDAVMVPLQGTGHVPGSCFHHVLGRNNVNSGVENVEISCTHKPVQDLHVQDLGIEVSFVA